VRATPRKLMEKTVFVACVVVKFSVPCIIGRMQQEPAGIHYADLAALLAEFEHQPPPTSLADFTDALRRSGREQWAASLTDLSEPDAVCRRLLGVYARLRYGAEIVTTLADLVACETFRSDDVAPADSPEIQKIGRLLEKLATGFGLKFENIGPHQVFRTWLPGSGEVEEIASAYAHTDVVDCVSRTWKIDDEEGREVDAFELTRIGDRLYGRGSQDCKGSLVVALYALRVLREAGVKPRRTLMLTMGTAEETGGDGIRFLLEELQRRGEEPPAFNVALDGNYPVQVAEKGYGVISVDFSPTERSMAADDEVQILAVTGSSAVNQIASISKIQLRCSAKKRDSLAATIQSVAERYRKDNLDAGQFSIGVEKASQADQLKVTVKGASAHSSEPESAVDPVSRAFGLLVTASTEVKFVSNEWLSAAHYADDLFGLGYLGKKWHIATEDHPAKLSAVDLGPLTICLTRIQMSSEGGAVVDANLRLPRGCDCMKIEAALKTKLAQWQKSRSATCTASFPPNEWWNATDTDESQPWIHDLLQIFAGVTGSGASLTFDTGGSSARFFSNSINFGPAMPDVDFEGHTDHEFKRHSQLLLDTQLVTEMFLSLGFN